MHFDFNFFKEEKKSFFREIDLYEGVVDSGLWNLYATVVASVVLVVAVVGRYVGLVVSLKFFLKFYKNKYKYIFPAILLKSISYRILLSSRIVSKLKGLVGFSNVCFIKVGGFQVVVAGGL